MSFLIKTLPGFSCEGLLTHSPSVPGEGRVFTARNIPEIPYLQSDAELTTQPGLLTM